MARTQYQFPWILKSRDLNARLLQLSAVYLVPKLIQVNGTKPATQHGTRFKV